MLVVGAHPDDELLGLGATLCRHILQGDEVHVLILCENMSLRYRSPEEVGFDTAEHARKAAKTLGIESVEVIGFPDQRLDEGPILEVIRPIEKAVKALQPRYVYTHGSGDINRDHCVAHEATLVACRCKAQSIQWLLAYETPSETEYGVPYSFSPNLFVDVTDFLDAKLEALKCYESELQDYPAAVPSISRGARSNLGSVGRNERRGALPHLTKLLAALRKCCSR